MKQGRFFFVCACGCGQKSEDVGKEYVRLSGGRKWFAEGCVPEGLKGKPYKGGFIVIQEDF